MNKELVWLEDNMPAGWTLELWTADNGLETYHLQELVGLKRGFDGDYSDVGTAPLTMVLKQELRGYDDYAVAQVDETWYVMTLETYSQMKWRAVSKEYDTEFQAVVSAYRAMRESAGVK